MIYQLRTANDLCGFKGMFYEFPEVIKKLKGIIKETEKFRSTLNDDILRICGWKKKVSRKEMENGTTITSIDDNILKDYINYFGREIELNSSDLQNYVNHKKELIKDIYGQETDGQPSGAA